MSAVAALGCLARGQRPDDALLPPCRLEGLGVELFGEEAILQQFRTSPLEGVKDAAAFQAPCHAALFTEDAALFADLHGERIARIWRLGPGEPREPEPAIGVAFDTDLVQSRRDVALRPEDHPRLAPDAVGAVTAIGRDIAHGWMPERGLPNWRTRPFLLRAFSDGDRSAALFAVYRLGAGFERSAGFAFVAAHLSVADGELASSHIVRDLAGEKAVEAAVWRPRVG